MGSKSTQVATLVERISRSTILVKMPSRDAVAVARALEKKIVELPAHLRCSLAWDRVLEMTRHCDFSVATDVEVYFCDPQNPWQRGTNEDTNRLLRQYFPKANRSKASLSANSTQSPVTSTSEGPGLEALDPG